MIKKDKEREREREQAYLELVVKEFDKLKKKFLDLSPIVDNIQIDYG